MQKLLRLLVSLHILLPFFSSLGHSAELPIRGKLPPEGTWVKYELSVSDGDNFNLGQGKAELTVKVLGREMRDAQQCRWLEVEFLTTVHEPDEQKFSAFFTKLTGVYKALVGENGLEAGDKEVTVFAIQTQVNHERPTLTDRPKVSAQLNSILQLIALLDEFLIVADQDPARLNKRNRSQGDQFAGSNWGTGLLLKAA